MRGMTALNRLIDENIVNALARTPKHLHRTIASPETLARLENRSSSQPARRRPSPAKAQAAGASYS